MKQLPFVVTAALLLVLATFIACRKTSSLPDLSVFNTEAAQEWYYSTFKKSAEYTNYNSALQGDKSPDWTKGTYHKIGSMEIVEFPLIKTKTSVSIPSGNSLTGVERKRIADASLSRIAFIKTAKNEIAIREMDYVPGWEYLAKTGFDISRNSIGQIDKDFSGELIIKTWKGNQLSRNILAGGKITGTQTSKRPVEVTETTPGNKTAQTTDCRDILFIEYERYCYGSWHGLYLVDSDCSEWTETGNSWYETICDRTSYCFGGFMSEECACALFGFCGFGGGGGDGDEGGDDEQNDSECINSLNELLSGEETSENLAGASTYGNDTTRQYDYPWIIFKQDQGLFYFESSEIGTHYRENANSLWKFRNLVHGTITLTGGVAGGNLEAIYVSGTPTVGIYNASMLLKYKIKASLVCKGSPFSRTDLHQSVGYFPANL